MFGANLVILAQIYDELSRGQAGFPRILSQNWQNDLEDHSQWSPFSIAAESIPRCMFGANLVILDQICDELSCGQGKVYGRTDGRTDGQTDRRRQRQYPFGLKGQRVKMNTMCTAWFGTDQFQHHYLAFQMYNGYDIRKNFKAVPYIL